MLKVYSSAPLPFQGQKRKFIKDFKEVLQRFDGITTVVDLFGGSGLLSHVTKRERPNVKVVYNDYDYFCDRLANVKTTNEILSRIRPIMNTVADSKKIPEELRMQILSIVKEYMEKGYVDYLTLSSSLLFSGRWAKNFQELSKETMYNVVKQSDYNVDGYLDGLEIVHEDYQDLFSRYKDDRTVLFLIDPPYLATDNVSYKNHWKLSDYLDVLKLLKGTKYVYFTSNKSQIIELCEWIKKNASIGNPFTDVEIRTQRNTLNYNSVFTDIMLVKE